MFVTVSRFRAVLAVPHPRLLHAVDHTVYMIMTSLTLCAWLCDNRPHHAYIAAVENCWRHSVAHYNTTIFHNFNVKSTICNPTPRSARVSMNHNPTPPLPTSCPAHRHPYPSTICTSISMSHVRPILFSPSLEQPHQYESYPIAPTRRTPPAPPVRAWISIFLVWLTSLPFYQDNVIFILATPWFICVISMNYAY